MKIGALSILFGWVEHHRFGDDRWTVARDWTSGQQGKAGAIHRLEARHEGRSCS